MAVWAEHTCVASIDARGRARWSKKITRTEEAGEALEGDVLDAVAVEHAVAVNDRREVTLPRQGMELHAAQNPVPHALCSTFPFLSRFEFARELLKLGAGVGEVEMSDRVVGQRRPPKREL